jgi:rubrerythrin
MNITTSAPIETVPEFLAHALELENESVEQYQQLADSMETHNNPEVAELFQKMAGFGKKHAAEVLTYAAGMELPRIPPWDFKWSGGESPESQGLDEVTYLMTACQALRISLRNERLGRDFYAHVADTSPSPEVQALAREFTDEEGEHVRLLEQWISSLKECHEELPPEDMDPPNMPE